MLALETPHRRTKSQKDIMDIYVSIDAESQKATRSESGSKQQQYTNEQRKQLSYHLMDFIGRWTITGISNRSW